MLWIVLFTKHAVLPAGSESEEPENLHAGAGEGWAPSEAPGTTLCVSGGSHCIPKTATLQKNDSTVTESLQM